VRRFWSWLGLNSGKHVGVVTLVGLAVTVGLGIGLGRVTFRTDDASYLNASDPAAIDNAAYQRAFGGDDMVTMVTMRPGTTVADLLRRPDRAALTAAADRLAHAPGVIAVISPLEVVELTSRLLASPTGLVTDSLAGRMQLAAAAAPQSAASRARRLAAAVASLRRYEAIPAADRHLGDPQWDDFLLYANDGSLRPGIDTYFTNRTHAELFVRLAGNQSIEQEGRSAAAVEAIMASAHIPDASTVTTGAPALLAALNDYLRGGLVKLTGLAAVLMVAILVLLFDVRWRLLPFGIVAVGLVWAFGVAGYAGIPMTLATIAALPVMLGIGIDYAIQMHARVEEEVLVDRVAHPIQATARNLCPALVVVTLDAVFCFLALQFSAVPMIRQFGVLLAVGVAVICLCSIVGPLAVLGVREHRSPTRPGRDFTRGRLSRLAVWLGSAPTRSAVPLAVGAVVVLLAGIAVEGRLQIQTNAIDWVNQHSALVHDVHQVERGVGTAGELDVVVRAPTVFSQPAIDFVSRFETAVAAANASRLQPAVSLVSVAEALTAVPGATTIPPTPGELFTVWASAPPTLRRVLVADHGRELSIVFRSKTANLTDLGTAVASIEHTRTPPGLSVAPAGIAAVGVGLLDNLEHNRALITYLAILFVLAWLSLRLRSPVRAVLSVVPVLVAVGLANLVAFALHVQLSPATAVGGPLVVAVCTEFTSLMLLRYLEERSRGLAPGPAFDAVSARTGRAFIVSGLTAVTGVAVMATSSLPLLQGFGVVVAANVLVALLCALVVLPPVVVWADRFGWVSRGMLRPDPEARPPVPGAAAPVPVAVVLGEVFGGR
jgi:hydrophobe/amphiphile efflux-3 (HAE3) family protein